MTLACSGSDDPAGSSGTTGTSTTDEGTSGGPGSDTADPSTSSTTGTASDSGGSSTTSTTDDSSGGTGTFIDPPDGGGAAMCDPFEQDCPEDEKCTAFATTPGTCCVDANKCVPIIGTKVEFDPCTRTEDNDDCAEGFFCMTGSSGMTGEGFCMRFCSVADAASCPEGTCMSWNDGVLPICEYDGCDPLLQDCPNGVGCYPGQVDGFICTASGADAGSGADGDACQAITSCNPGLTCVGADSLSGCNDASCCTPWCDTGGDGSACTDPSEECVAYFEAGMAPPEYTNVGICAIPM